MSGPILVATDGTRQSLGALRVARKLEEEEGARVEVLAVVEPVPVFDTGFMVSLPETQLHEARATSIRDEVGEQLETVTGSASAWSVHVSSGLPGPRIVNKAEELGVDLIVIGLGRHRAVDRLFGGETALQVARLAHVPVLAVPPDLMELPHIAVVAVDFSPFSEDAARTAITLLRSPVEIHLVHVISGLEFLPTVPDDWRREYEKDLTERMEEFRDTLGIPKEWKVTMHVLAGDPGPEIMSFAKAHEADLVAAGSHGHSFIGRILMGSVSTRLIRGCDSLVLISPPREVAEEITGGAAEVMQVPPWARDLHEFTRRNAGRRTDLEIDDPVLGAQHCGTNFPLRGVDYDPRRDRVDIMLGEQGNLDRHLTHSIPSPRSIEVVTGEGGRDEALRIGIDGGQVLLRILHD